MYLFMQIYIYIYIYMYVYIYWCGQTDDLMASPLDRSHTHTHPCKTAKTQRKNKEVNACQNISRMVGLSPLSPLNQHKTWKNNTVYNCSSSLFQPPPKLQTEGQRFCSSAGKRHGHCLGRCHGRLLGATSGGFSKGVLHGFVAFGGSINRGYPNRW